MYNVCIFTVVPENCKPPNCPSKHSVFKNIPILIFNKVPLKNYYYTRFTVYIPSTTCLRWHPLLEVLAVFPNLLLNNTFFSFGFCNPNK